MSEQTLTPAKDALKPDVRVSYSSCIRYAFYTIVSPVMLWSP